MSSDTEQTAQNEASVHEFAERIRSDTTTAFVVILAAFGDRLGLWRVIGDAGPVTPSALAERAGIAHRYAEEWLCAMAAAGYLRYEPESATFRLPDEHVPVLALDESSVSFCGALQWIFGFAPALDKLTQAFRNGQGVARAEYGDDTWPALERFSKPWYENLLVPQWLPAMTEVQAALAKGVDVADFGCGAGHALIKLAQTFPSSRYVGYDIFEPQIERARANAHAAGVEDRVRFEVRDVTRGLRAGCDLAFTFQTLDDCADPLSVLRAIRDALRPSGRYVCVELECSPDLEDNLGQRGALFYSLSVLYCMSTSLAEGGAGQGSFGLPEAKFTELCTMAGFTATSKLPIGDSFNCVYEVLR